MSCSAVSVEEAELLQGAALYVREDIIMNIRMKLGVAAAALMAAAPLHAQEMQDTMVWTS